MTSCVADVACNAYDVISWAGAGEAGSVPQDGLRDPGGRGTAEGAARDAAGGAQRSHTVQGTLEPRRR